MTIKLNSTQLEDVVAQTYSAIARPDRVIELLGAVSRFPERSADSTNALETHLANAASIIDQMYPLNADDLAALDTQGDRVPDSDLAMDALQRVVHVNSAVLADPAFIPGQFLPEWALDGVGRGVPERECLPRNETPRLVRLHCSEDDADGSWFMVRREELDEGLRFHFFAVRMQWDDRHGLSFQEALSLSDVETMLLRHLVRGGTLRGFADRRDRSLGTVRNQMKVLQRKLGVRSKEEVLLLYAGFASTMDGSVNRTSPAPHECTNLLHSDDGSIAWEEMGDPQGRPVVFFHPLEGALMPNRAERAFRQHGLRIIAPWRPFHGDTSGEGFGQDGIESFAAKVSGLLEHLGVSRATAFATQAGAPYMMACIKRSPTIFDRAIGAGAFLPIGTESEMGLIPASHRMSIRAVRTAPAIARMYQRGMLAAIGSGSFHRFVEDFYDGYERELDAVRHPELLSVFRRAASYSIASTLDGPIDTMQFWASDWSELFSDIKVPLSLVYGTHDANMPRVLVEAVSARLGLRCASFVENAGSFLLMDSPEAVARLLSER